MTQPCDDIRPLLEPAIRNELSPSEQDRVRRHVTACADCRSEKDQLDRLCGLLQVALLPADRAALDRQSRPAKASHPKMLAAGLVAFFLIPLGLILMWRPSASILNAEGSFLVSTGAEGPWTPLSGRLPRPGDYLTGGKQGGRLQFHDGSTYAIAPGAVISVGQDRDTIAILQGRVRAEFPSRRRPRISVPAGSVNGEGTTDPCVIEITVDWKGERTMNPAYILLSVSVLSGSAHVTFDGTSRLAHAGDRLHLGGLQDDEVGKLLAEFQKAVEAKDAAARTDLFEKIAARGAEALQPMRAALQSWSVANSPRVAELNAAAERLLRTIKARLEKGLAADDLMAERGKVMDETAALEALKYSLQSLEEEIDFRDAVGKGGPALATPWNVFRSFEHFASQKKWEQAMLCVTPADEKTARAFHERLEKMRAAGPGFTTTSWSEGTPVIALSPPGGKGDWAWVSFEKAKDGRFRISKLELKKPGAKINE